MHRQACLAAALGLIAAVAGAQEPGREVANAPAVADEAQNAAVAMSPEMDRYQQELQRWDDPQQAVRRAAEERAAQRRQRIAARKWYGVSNARPIVSHTPFMYWYAPRRAFYDNNFESSWRGGSVFYR